ncbi:YppG family protein [Pueribacillus sp. YX66]|uniref:YppG family protein n=1 Tax=Pueribacillus sp. YX66 TaxID=3229242 RepID=UPI00358D2FED
MVFPPHDPFGFRPPGPPPPYQHPHFYGQPRQPNRPSFVDQFRKQDGKWDYEKMINHGGQIVSIVNQARPLVKQMGPLLSLFKK